MARIANIKNKVESLDDVQVGDTIVIFYAKNSRQPYETLTSTGKFLAGIVEGKITHNNKIELSGSWGNFTITEDDSIARV